jgi:exosome complex RNA-binding protein Csl4
MGNKVVGRVAHVKASRAYLRINAMESGGEAPVVGGGKNDGDRAGYNEIPTADPNRAD